MPRPLSELLEQSSRETRDVQIPGLGEVRIRELSGAQRYELAGLTGDDGAGVDATLVNRRLLGWGLTDETGAECSDEDVERLLSLHGGAPIGELVRQISRLSGLAADDDGDGDEPAGNG